MWLSTFKDKFSKINKTGSLSCTVYTGDYISDLVMRKDFIRIRKYNHRESPGSLLVRTLDFHCHGPGSIPGQGTEIWQTADYDWKKTDQPTTDT